MLPPENIYPPAGVKTSATRAPVTWDATAGTPETETETSGSTGIFGSEVLVTLRIIGGLALLLAWGAS